MKSAQVFAVRLIALVTLVSPLASQAQSPDLKVLQVQYDNLVSERVTEGYHAGLAKLDAGYLAGVERGLAEAKAAGDLQSALSLQEEIKRIASKEALPGNDEQAAVPLKKLRAIYRAELTKLETQRASGLAALLPPYLAKLKQLEADLTKADRLTDAKAVMDYRQGLAAGVPMKAAVASSTGTVSVTSTPSASLPAGGFTNTLGMKFVPVPGTKVLFCIHTTRVKDYAVYYADVPGVDASWRNQVKDGIPISDKDDDPVIGVNWDEAKAFCEWLSKKEGRTYRLPTDREWSVAVGIGSSEKVADNTTPENLHLKIMEVFPWGTKWPPPKGAGNYADTSLKEKLPKEKVIDGYTDGFATTSPVMSFKPNKLGLYDMGGNVMQWVEDWFNAEQKERVLRGGSWYGNDRYTQFSCYRHRSTPSKHHDRNGFRVVVESSAR